MALMIPIIAVSIPVVAILVDPWKRRMAMAERREARKMYERIVMEKLDVIKTAIAMGQGSDHIKDLDQRLERLIGSDQLGRLLDEKKPKAPEAPAELRDYRPDR